jgi:hypothetical protein
MKPVIRPIVALSAVFCAVFAAGCRNAGPFSTSKRGALADDIIAGWSNSARLTAAKMMAEYGPPDAVAKEALAWEDKGRWMRIVVWDGGPGILEQTVAYRVPENKRRALEGFTENIRVSQDGASMSARSDDEAINFLAINLADDIGRGAIDAPQARHLYRKILAMTAAGKSSPLTLALLIPQGS